MDVSWYIVLSALLSSVTRLVAYRTGGFQTW